MNDLDRFEHDAPLKPQPPSRTTLTQSEINRFLDELVSDIYRPWWKLW